MKTLASGSASMRSFRLALSAAIILLCIGITLSAYCAFSAFANGNTRTVIDTQGNEIEVPASTMQAQNLSDGGDTELSPADDCSITQTCPKTRMAFASWERAPCRAFTKDRS